MPLNPLTNQVRLSLCMRMLALLIPAFVSSCSEYTPRPHGFPRLEFPQRSYMATDIEAPYQFEMPVYAVLKEDDGQSVGAYWYNLNFPQFDATVHLSYKQFDSQEGLDSLTEDAYKLAMKHTIKAEDIRETEIEDTTTGNYGVLYDFYGRTATPFNFYITDQKSHFLRGAFYFNQQANSDSVSPIFDFLKTDLIHMIRTLEWQSL